ncbi:MULTISPECIES: hypothetical protein [Burkholderia cepacia complex]|uniref:hypothetical protein n=1 Tax=Burkholderia cepacia complex TaxID=87882 RepID=UPI0012D97088|nr:MULTISPECIES: hypothetical protein [Burkholderia cepacia complex]
MAAGDAGDYQGDRRADQFGASVSRQRAGWHFADAVQWAMCREQIAMKAAIDDVIHEWTHYPVNEGLRRTYRMAPGMRYLDGLVQHHALAEAISRAWVAGD